MARDGEVIQRQHFCHHGDTICDPNSTERLHVDETIMRSFQAELFSHFLHRRMLVEFVIFRVQDFLSA